MSTINQFSLFNLSQNELVKSLKLGEIFQIKNGVKLRALDMDGKIFVESESRDNVVVLKDKVVIEMAQGQTGDEITIDNERFVLLKQGQVYINDKPLDMTKLAEAHQLSENALRLIEDDYENRPLNKLKLVVSTSGQEAKAIVGKNNYKSLKIAGGILTGFAVLVTGLMLLPEPSKDIVKVENAEASQVEVLAATKPVEMKSKLVVENDLRAELEAAKEIAKTWTEKFEQAAKSSDEVEKFEIYSSLIESGKSKSELWEAYPDANKIEKYFQIRINKLLRMMKSEKVAAATRKESFEALTAKKNLLSPSDIKKISSYEYTLSQKVKRSWVKAAFDPAAVRKELQSVSALLPENHKLRNEINEKLEAL